MFNLNFIGRGKMLDKKDIRILNLLAENSRLSYRQMAKRLRLAVATVINRVRKLEKEKVIKSYSVMIDHDKVGYDIKVIIEMRIEKGKLFQVEKKISNHPSVLAIYDVTGPFDSIIIASFKNRVEMDKFLKEIQTYDFVERTETKLVLNTIKEDVLRV